VIDPRAARRIVEDDIANAIRDVTDAIEHLPHVRLEGETYLPVKLVGVLTSLRAIRTELEDRPDA
jgi:hypothetical protein